jgi:hypothetical protein
MLGYRLAAIKSSCARSRTAFFATTIISGTVCLGVWNTYFTWSRHVMALPDYGSSVQGEPDDQAKRLREVALQQQVKIFMKNRDINLPLLGIHVSSDDMPLLSGLALLGCSFYQLLSWRLANRDVASLLIEAAQYLHPKWMRHVYFGIRSEMLFNATNVREKPVDDLAYRFRPVDPDHAQIARSVRFVLYLPTVAVIVAILSDVYYSFLFNGNYDLKFATAVWSALSLPLKIELVVIDTVAMGIAVVIWYFNKLAVGHLRGMFSMMASFARVYHARFTCSIYDPSPFDRTKPLNGLLLRKPAY